MSKRSKRPQPPASEADMPGPRVVPVEIEVPLSTEIPNIEGSTYVSLRVEVGHLTPEQRTALWRLRKGLNESHARLANGRHVDHSADAVRWMLEKIVGSGEKKGRSSNDE